MPRSAHAAWSIAEARRDPVGLLTAADQGRLPALLPLRYRRMRADPFAFLRGSAALMAADLAGMPSTGLRVQACGDAHLMNFGAYASPEGTPVFDINDFDETLPAPFEWDIKRLAASVVVAAGAHGLGEKPARALARRVAHAYRQQMDALASLPPLDAWRTRIDLDRAIEDIGDRDVRRRERHMPGQRPGCGRQRAGGTWSPPTAGCACPSGRRRCIGWGRGAGGPCRLRRLSGQPRRGAAGAGRALPAA